MISKDMKREIIATVNAAVREAMRETLLAYREEWVSEEELCKRIQMFTRSWMRDNGRYLPQARSRYRDSRGNEHDSRTVYAFHAIQKMILEDDLDFTRPDRAVYRKRRSRDNDK